MYSPESLQANESLEALRRRQRARIGCVAPAAAMAFALLCLWKFLSAHFLN